VDFHYRDGYVRSIGDDPNADVTRVEQLKKLTPAAEEIMIVVLYTGNVGSGEG